MHAAQLQVYSDSQVVVNQINGSYEAKEPQLQKYLARVRQLLAKFSVAVVSRIPRSQNKRADALSKLASSSFLHLNKKVLVEVLSQRSIDAPFVGSIEEAGDTWMTPIFQYLESGSLPEDKLEVKKLMFRATRYVIQNGVLYKRAYLQPLLRCIGPTQAEYIMKEVHLGSCGSHEGPRSMTRKILRWGYYWPTIASDTFYFVRKCDKCQRFAPIT